MIDQRNNPFDITKAVDFSDKEINDYWVDFSGDGNFVGMVKPQSAMPMFILGGKGSGKTHLMRYFSYDAQKLRAKTNIVDKIKADKYVGIFLRCSALNTTRFIIKDTSENWPLIFSYYMDLWLSQLVLMVVNDSVKSSTEFLKSESIICDEVFKLISIPSKKENKPSQLGELLKLLYSYQRELDLAINNYSFSPEKISKLTIRTAPGKLIFAIPQIISKYFKPYQNISFLYLIDELENLTKEQQKYVNTIVREKEAPASFKIGARLYGVRTSEVYGSGEINKEGSEYELLHLDEKLRDHGSKKYNAFSKKLCLRRLSESGFISQISKEIEFKTNMLDSFFETHEKGRFLENETSFVRKKYLTRTRPYFERLKNQLKQLGQGNNISTPIGDGDITKIVNYLSCDEYPLVEKLNIYLLYQDWGKSKNILSSAKTISAECKTFIFDDKQNCRHKRRLSHFQSDLYAQLLRDCNFKQRYYGMSDFIGMSAGLPRNLLTILKHIYQWSVFNDESPFVGSNKILFSSQRDGVIEASDWFFRDARIIEVNGTVIQDSISRLATLFKDIRFSDKPTESSLSTFSTDLTKVSANAKENITAAIERSLLINIRGGQRDRNTKRVDSKLQINPMLSPRWDLPVHRRGVIALSNDEVNAIFDPDFTESLDQLTRIRIGRMSAPSFDSQNNSTNTQSEMFK